MTSQDNLRLMIEREADIFFDWSDCKDKRAVTTVSAKLFAEHIAKIHATKLEAAIIETLEENTHLADGDICTLIKLKRALE
jgi:hypothetical protein